MPTDSRRLTGPETSRSPYDYCQSATSVDLETLQQVRPDGRQPKEMRPIFLKAGVITQARGSAYIEMNQTKVICAVYGPREVMRRESFSLKGQLTCDFKFCQFSLQQRQAHQQDNKEKELSMLTQEAIEPAICLHKYPKSQISIYISVLQNDGSALSAAIISASVAVASAGVEMFDLVVASSVALHGGHMLVDPCISEEEACLNTAGKKETKSGVLTVAMMPSIHQMSAVSSDGNLQFDSITQGTPVCTENCLKVYQVVHQTLLEYLKDKS